MQYNGVYLIQLWSAVRLRGMRHSDNDGTILYANAENENKYVSNVPSQHTSMQDVVSGFAAEENY